MKTCVIGLGYIGLPTAAVIARKGLKVLGVDVNERTVDTINQGKIHIVEPDLDQIVHETVKNGFLSASTQASEADVFVIAVPTPFKKGDSSAHVPDMSYVEEATKSILPILKGGDLIILESTSPVESTETILAPMIESKGFKVGEDIYLAYCPERVLPGKIIKELVENDRVIGGFNQISAEKAKEFYSQFIDGNCYITNSRTAEMAKLVENSYRDVNIAFANELSMISEKFNIDVFELIELANKHPRVNILKPGPGVGGHCIAVDPWFIVDSCKGSAKLIEQSRLINDSKPNFVIDKVVLEAEKKASSKIACLGLSYKADIDDLRESPALYIAQELSLKFPNRVLCCEPNVDSYKGLTLESLEQCVNECEILVLLVAQKEFKTVKFSKLNEKSIIDSCGLIEER